MKKILSCFMAIILFLSISNFDIYASEYSINANITVENNLVTVSGKLFIGNEGVSNEYVTIKAYKEGTSIIVDLNQTKTNANGEYTFKFVCEKDNNNKYVVEIQNENASVTKVFENKGETEKPEEPEYSINANVVVEKDLVTVTGRLLKDAKAMPNEYVTIKAYKEGTSIIVDLNQTKTNANGEYTFKFVCEKDNDNKYVVEIQNENASVTKTFKNKGETEKPEEPEYSINANIVVENKEVTITGTLLKDAKAMPSEDVNMKVYTKGNTLVKEATTKTNTNGEYTFEFTCEEGKYRVVLESAKAKTTKVFEIKGEDKDQDQSSSHSSKKDRDDNKETNIKVIDKLHDGNIKTEITANVGNDGKGNTKITIDKNIIREAIKNSEEAIKKDNVEKGRISIRINSKVNLNTKFISTELSQEVQELLLQEKDVKDVVIKNNLIEIKVETDLLRKIRTSVNAPIKIKAKKVNKANIKALNKDALMDNEIYDLEITYEKNGEEIKYTSFDKEKVKISLPVTLENIEDKDELCAVYIAPNGKLVYIANSYYDEESKSIIFETGHFSVYAIGKLNHVANNYKDIKAHWANKDISYLLDRKLFNGTTAHEFSPNKAMTRGMFITVLGRFNLTETETFTNSSFNDVNATDYYAPYIEWAKEAGVAKGLGNNEFKPNKVITRQEMIVMLNNYCEVYGIECENTNQKTFDDEKDISTWAKKAVDNMKGANIINGNNNRFEPNKEATRAEVATVIRRFIELTK